MRHTLVFALAAATVLSAVASCERPNIPSNYRHEPSQSPAEPSANPPQK